MADDESSKSYIDKTLPELLTGMQVKITCAPPDNDLDTWSGRITATVPQKNAQSFSLKFDNLLLRGATLQKTKWVVGVVVHTGRHTKMKMDDKPRKSKKTRIDVLMSKMILGTLCLQFCLVCAFATFKMVWSAANQQETMYLLQVEEITVVDALKSWCTYLLLLSPMIPISLYVTLEFVKIGQNIFINKDAQMYSR